MSASKHQPSPASHDDLDPRMGAERIALLFRETPPTLALATIFSVVMVIVLRDATAPATLAAWWLALNGVSLARYLFILKWRRLQPGAAEMGRWGNAFIAMTLVAGLLWGLLGTELFPKASVPTALFVYLFLVAVLVTGVFTLGSSILAYGALAVAVTVPGLVTALLPGHERELPYVAMFCLFALACCMNVLRLQRNFKELIRLRFVNADIAQQNERSLRAAEEASRVKSMFLANMSHEIRTPLNGVLGMAQIVLSGPLAQQQRERVDTLYRSAEHLLVIINDILDFSKVEAGQLQLTPAPFELRRALAESTDLIAIRAREKRVGFTLEVAGDAPQWLMGDVARFKQVVNNLVGNAVKFTDVGAVAVTVTLEHRDGAPRLLLAVDDTGIGIDARDARAIFEPFGQADGSHARRHGGTGLGLSICRQLVQLMGGELAFTSQPGRGSCFWFEIPSVACEPPPATSRPDRYVPLSGTLLVVEDSPVNLEVATLMLQGFGLKVQAAVDGEEALARLSQTRFDVVLMDCHLPGMDGFEATRRFRAQEAERRAPHTPVVALTANAVEGDRERCLAAGMDDYLAKPFRQEDLYCVVQRNLAGGRDAWPNSGAPLALRAVPPGGSEPSLERSGGRLSAPPAGTPSP